MVLKLVHVYLIPYAMLIWSLNKRTVRLLSLGLNNYNLFIMFLWVIETTTIFIILQSQEEMKCLAFIYRGTACSVAHHIVFYVSLLIAGNDAGKRSESNRNLLDILRSSRGRHLQIQNYNNMNLRSFNLKRPWRLLTVQNMGRIIPALSPEASLKH